MEAKRACAGGVVECLCELIDRQMRGEDLFCSLPEGGWWPTEGSAEGGWEVVVFFRRNLLRVGDDLLRESAAVGQCC